MPILAERILKVALVNSPVDKFSGLKNAIFMTLIKFNQVSLIIFPQNFVVVRKIFNTVVERLAKTPEIVASRKLETTSLNRCFTRSIIFKTVSFKSSKKFLILNSTILYFTYIEGITAFISNQISASISPNVSLKPIFKPAIPADVKLALKNLVL